MTRYFDLVPGYESLATVYDSAIEQASEGKGRERHASEGEAYEKQIICEVARRVGLGYPLGQAVKKIYESQRLGGERGVAELLGALNYIAAAVIVMREGMETDPKAEAEPEFKPGDKVQFCQFPHADVWFDGVVERVEGCLCFIRRSNGVEVSAPKRLIRRPEAKAEGCEDLVQDSAVPEEYEGCMMMLEADAPQTKEELFNRIVDCNPSTFGCVHKPTGEELAEMAEEDAHG